MGDLVGQSLSHFRIVAKLGEGGMGVVYEATDEKLRRKVALKVLPDSFAQDEDRRRRFLREARSAAAVTHANIATVYDVGEADGHVFIAMELVEGETLRARLEKGLTVTESVNIAKEIARGLARAHDKGIVHRDLKPENVMITLHDEVKILDFGLAKLREEQAAVAVSPNKAVTQENLTREGRVLGTPGYMSPEQTLGDAADARTDIFAFGVVLFEMLTGERPFAGATAVAVMLAVNQDTPKRASTINPRVSGELDRVIERCLERFHDARYAQGQELLDALNALLPELRASEPRAPKPASAPTVSLLTPGAAVVEPRRRSRWAWTVLGFAGIAAAGIAIHHGRHGVDGANGSTSASPLGEAPAASVTTLSNLPPPTTKISEAAAEYAAGMQALHDNSWAMAERHFQRAAELDPTLAIAHLRVSMAAFGGSFDVARMRDEFGKVAPLRAQLSPRDQTLLEALEPILRRVHGDRQEAVARLERARRMYPLDVEFLDWLGFLQLGNPAAGLPSVERAIELDAGDGQAWQTKGRMLALLGRDDEARATFERCAAVTLNSTDCLGELSRLDAVEGRCDDYERDGRRLLDREPDGANVVANAMVAKGRPSSAVLELLDQATDAASFDAARRAMDKRQSRAVVAMATGDMALARELGRQNLVAVSSNPATRTDAPERQLAASLVLDALQEMGEDDEVRKMARDFFAQGTESWASYFPFVRVDGVLSLSRLAVGREGFTQEEFEKRRVAWIAEQEAAGDSYPGLIWVFGYAAPARTPDEARSALAVLPRFAPLSSYLSGGPGPDAYIGRTFLLAGQAKDAIPYLTRAAANCNVLDAFLHLRAALDLGTALEATKETQSACAAYKVVLGHWGHAKPRSVTADKARERAKALACPP